MTHKAYYLYAVLDSMPKEIPLAQGVGGALVELSEVDELVYCYSQIPIQLPVWTKLAYEYRQQPMASIQEMEEKSLLAQHQLLLLALSRECPTIYPFHYGAIFSSMEKMEEYLMLNIDRLQDGMDASSGYYEYQLALKPYLANPLGDISGKEFFLAKYERYKQERLLEREADRYIATLASYLPELQLFRLSEKVEDDKGLRLSLILPKGSPEIMGVFKQACERFLQAEPSLRMRISGPWPPYWLHKVHPLIKVSRYKQNIRPHDTSNFLGARNERAYTAGYAKQQPAPEHGHESRGGKQGLGSASPYHSQPLKGSDGEASHAPNG